MTGGIGPALEGLWPVVHPRAWHHLTGPRAPGGWNELHPLLGSAWSRQLWDLLTPKFSSSQPPKIPRWTWAFLVSLLVLGKHPRLPVDHTERCCLFTVGNDVILKTLLYTQGLHPSVLLHAAGADTYLGRRKHYHIPPFPPLGWPVWGLRGPVCDAGRSTLCSVPVCFYLGTTCSLTSLGILIR